MELRRILVGVDGEGEDGRWTPGSRVAVNQAVRLAQQVGASLAFLHARHADEEGKLVPVEGLVAEVDALRESLGESVEGCELEVVEERPWIALTRRAIAGQADLVVVAKRNRTVRDDRRLGSTSQELLRNCPVPVWVVRPDHELHHRHVLAATDLTPVGDRAVALAAQLAAADGAELCVVHAWQTSMVEELTAARSSGDERDAHAREVHARVLEHVASIPGHAALGDRSRVAVVRDTPSRAILRAVEELDPDLVVMGTVSRGGVPGLLLGNTAEKLLHKLEPSILAVKPSDFISPLAADPISGSRVGAGG